MSVAHSSPAVESVVSITPLLKRLWENKKTSADEVAAAISHIFTNSLSPVQSGALLTALHFHDWDSRPDVLMRCSQAMRNAALQFDRESLDKLIKTLNHGEGDYMGGLCDIVGTGGDSHNTFNISTTSSIIASSMLMIGKHGNRSATSKSGSADVLNKTSPRPPILTAVTPETLNNIYESTNYAFLFAPVFHPGMKYVSPIRKELGWRTIFNLLGPLSNPLYSLIEASVIGVARRDLGGRFADALRLSGVKKAMIVCGEEELDEVSCAGPTLCWQLVEQPRSESSSHPNGESASAINQDGSVSNSVSIQHFKINPSDFGLQPHHLSEVGSGKEASENATTLMQILRGELADDNPILDFVLMNTAALLVVSGICEVDVSHMGPGDDGKVIKERGPGGLRWKEGMRRARWGIKSGAALRQWEKFVEVTNDVTLAK